MIVRIQGNAAETAASVRTRARRISRATGKAAPWLFVREVLNHPAGVGAVWPSSRALAQRMAARVPINGDGLVVELGAGTGVVTEALLDHGVDAGRLVVVERSPKFVRHLRTRFPEIRVLHGDAANLGRLLPEAARLDAIVSSLPLRSLPAADRVAIVDQWRHLLPAKGLAIQYTYDLRAAGRMARYGFVVRGRDTVWTNLPPARIVVLGSETPAGAANRTVDSCPESAQAAE